MELTLYVLLLTSFLLPSTLQQDLNNYNNGCTQQEKDPVLCVSKVYCREVINMGWDINSFETNSICPISLYFPPYGQYYSFGQTQYKLINFGNDIYVNEYLNQIITTLDLSENDYTVIPKIRSENTFGHLQTLNLSHNLLTNAKLYNSVDMPELSLIDLSFNTISTIDVNVDEYVFNRLRKINLSHNYLVTIQDSIFDSFPDLEHLDLSHNFIDTLGIETFEGLKKMIYLSLKHNRLTEVGSSLFRFTKLTELDLSENKIEIIKFNDFQKLTNLKTLDVSSNVLTVVEEDVFSMMGSIETINLRNNLLENVGKELFANTSSLKNINLSKNHLKTLPKNLFKDKTISDFSVSENILEGMLIKGTFEGLKLVKDLDLSHQQLTSIEDYAFYGLEELVTLMLNDNSLKSLSKMSFNTLRSLEVLDLSNNQLTNIQFDKTDLISLSSLLLEGNSLNQVKCNFFEGLNSLQLLGLSRNKISKLETKSFKSLKELINFKISYNPLSGSLEEGTFDGLNSLPGLDISGTLLTTIKNGSFNGMTQLKILNASHSNISDLEFNSFLGTGLIETIDLSFNLLRDFTLNTTELLNLQTLILNYNQLTMISPTFFKGMLRLMKIILSHNQIVRINDGGFADQQDLWYLDLSFNTNLEVNISQIERAQNINSLQLSGIQNSVTFGVIKEMRLSNLAMSYSNINNVTSIALQKLTSLEYLELKHNNISRIDSSALYELKKLRELDLSVNKIVYIQPGAFKDSTLLRLLNISHNMLTVLNYGIFRGLIYLDTLDISYNEINDLKSERFYELQSLSILIADHNKINYVNGDEFVGTNLRKLSIGDNPIPCHVFVNLKKGSTEFIITAIRLDEGSDAENVDGVTCNMDKSEVKINRNTDNLQNTQILLDIKEILRNMSLNKVIENTIAPLGNDSKILMNIDDKIDKMSSNLSSIMFQGTFNTSELLEKISSSVVQGNKVLDKMLGTLIRTKSVTPVVVPPQPNSNITIESIIPYINRIKEDLENTMAVDKQNMYDEIERRISDKIVTIKHKTEILTTATTPTREAFPNTDNGSNNSLVFIEVCVGLILVILVALILYKFYNSGRFIPAHHSSSTRHLSSDIENSAL